MKSLRLLLHSTLLGGGAFIAASCALLACAAQLSGWHPPSPLEPLEPEPIALSSPAEPLPIVTSSLGGATHDGLSSAHLTAPRAGADVGVVLVAGAGAADRESMQPLAEELARSGVAVLTYDKRTAGYSASHRDYDQLADDALLAVDMLRSATGITRVGALGISEGAWVVSTAAGRADSSLSFAVLGSAPVVSPLEQVSWIVDATIADAPLAVRAAAATVLAGGRTIVDYLEYDSQSVLSAADVPVLAVWGADDPTVPVNEAYRRLRATLADDLTARIVAGAGHNIFADSTSWLTAAAEWMRRPAGPSLAGTEPATPIGVAVPPPSAWIADPRLHFLVSLTAGVIVTFAVIRRSRATLERTIS